MHQKTETLSVKHLPSNGPKNFRWLQLVLLSSALLFTGCLADTHEGLTKAALAAQDEMMTVMESIKDKRTATLAAPKLEKLFKRMQDLNERAEKLEKPDAETMQKVMKLRSDHAKKQFEKIGNLTSNTALTDPEVAQVLGEIMEKIQNANK